MENYHLGDSLGEGAEGKVFRATERTTGKIFAIKQSLVKNYPGCLDRLLEEGKIMMSLMNNPNIVESKEFF